MSGIGSISRLLQDHPVHVSALGMTALVMKAETLLSALSIAILFCLVLGFSTVSVAALRRFIPAEYRLVYLLVITSTWVAMLDMLTASLFFGMRLHLDIYLPLMALNGLILLMLESRALKSPVSALLPGLVSTGLIVTLLLIGTGLLREWLASGTLLTDRDLLGLSSVTGADTVISQQLTLASTAAGAFITLGLLLALVNVLRDATGQVPGNVHGTIEGKATGSMSGH